MPQVSEFVIGFGYGLSTGAALASVVWLIVLIRQAQTWRRRYSAEAQAAFAAANALTLARLSGRLDTTLFESHPPSQKPAEWPFPPGPKGWQGKKLTKQ